MIISKSKSILYQILTKQLKKLNRIFFPNFVDATTTLGLNNMNYSHFKLIISIKIFSNFPGVV